MSMGEPGSTRIWRLVAAVMDGKDVPVGRSTVLESGPEGYTIKVNGRVFMRGTSRSDASRSPVETDAYVAEGPNQGRTIPQIQRVDGDVMVVCSGKPGSARPSEFTSPPGSGRTLGVWFQDDLAVRLSHRPSIAYQWFAILPVLFLADNVGAAETALTPSLGHWGAVAAIGLVLAVFQMVVCRLLKWSWRGGIVCGVSVALFLMIDKELSAAIEPALGHSGSVIVALATSAVAALLTWQVSSRLLGVEA